MPFPEQAPAAKPIAGYAVMSWHRLVELVSWVPGPWSPPPHRPAMSPVCSFVKMRGSLTTRASWGRSRGTRITSIRKNEVFGSSAPRLEQPSNSSGARTRELVPCT